MTMIRVVWSPRLLRRTEKYEYYDSYRRISQRKLEELPLTITLTSPTGRGNAALFSHILPTDTVGVYNF